VFQKNKIYCIVNNVLCISKTYVAKDLLGGPRLVDRHHEGVVVHLELLHRSHAHYPSLAPRLGQPDPVVELDMLSAAAFETLQHTFGYKHNRMHNIFTRMFGENGHCQW
jgi:hypothetical protein